MKPLNSTFVLKQSGKMIPGPFVRPVNRVRLLGRKQIQKETGARLSVADVPVLVVPVDTAVQSALVVCGISEIEGCDLLFFDVLVGERYFCNVASAGDADVVSSMVSWNKAGYMPVLLLGSGAQACLVRQPFELNRVYEQAIVDAARPDFLSDLQKRFQLLLEPNAIESLVASRHALAFKSLSVGFVETKGSGPGLEAIQ